MAMPVVNREHLVSVQILVDSGKRPLAEGLAHPIAPEEEYLVPAAQLRHLVVLQQHPADLVVVVREGGSLVLTMHRSRQLTSSVPRLLLLLNRVEASLAPLTNRGLALQTLPRALAGVIPVDYLVVLSNRRRNPASLLLVTQAQVTRFNRVEPTIRTIPVVVYLVVQQIQHSELVNNSNRRQVPTLLAALEAIKIKLKLAHLRSAVLGALTSRHKSLEDFLVRLRVRVMEVVYLVVTTNKITNSSRPQAVFLAVVRVTSLPAVRCSVKNLLRPALGSLAPTLRILRMVWGVVVCLEAPRSPIPTITRISRIKAVDFSASTISCNNRSLAVYSEPLEHRLVAAYSITTPNRHPVDHCLDLSGRTTSHSLQVFLVATITLLLRLVSSSQTFFSLHKLSWPLWRMRHTETTLFFTVSLRCHRRTLAQSQPQSPRHRS